MISETTARDLLAVFKKYIDPACYDSIANDLSKVKGNKSFIQSIELFVKLLQKRA